MVKKKAKAVNASIASNTQWNVPDWKDAGAYPRPEDLSLTYWRWEFLRRRQDYKEDFEAHALPTYNFEIAEAKATPPQGKQIRIVSPDHPEFRARLIYLAKQDSEEALTAFRQALNRLLPYDLSQSGLPNPRCVTPHRLQFEQGFGGFIFGPINDGRIYRPLRENQIAVIFCVSKPLAPQEAFAGHYLREIQKHKYGKKIGRRARRNDWPSYLRALDAKAAGVPLHVIGRTVLRFSGTNEQIATRVLQDILEPAYELGINFPN